MRKRNHPVYVRFSDQEYDQLMEKVTQSGQTLQSYIIHTSLSGRVTSAEEVAELRAKNEWLSDIDRQLRGMGTNLNQMARIANGYGWIPSADDLEQIASDVKEIKAEVNAQWRSTRQSISQQNPTVQ